MKLDHTLTREIKAINGDGSREARFSFLKRLEAAKDALSLIGVGANFDECVKNHGRATVAICIEVTLYERRERLDGWGLPWALEVLKRWTNCVYANYHRAYIDDQLHPTRICNYAASFIRLTTEN